MSAANKAKGTRFESEVADYLQGQGIDARRLPRTGVKDIGDVELPMNLNNMCPDHSRLVIGVIEAKNRRAMDLPTWIAEAEQEADNYAEKYPLTPATVPIVVHKRRGKGVHQSYVTMSLDTLVDLLRQVGAV